MKKRLKLAVLLSGGGTTLKNLLEWRDQGRLLADFGLVVSSRPNVGGLKIAADAGIPTEVVWAKEYMRAGREGEEIHDWTAMSAALNKLLLAGGFDLVCMAGFLSRYVIPDELIGRVLNIHPSLIPMFCGQGMYGMAVHRAVVASGVKLTGCTVHFADNNYDSGPIILQRACPVYCDDTPEEVAARVFAEECLAYPIAVNLMARGRVRLTSPRQAYVEDDRVVSRFGNI